MKEFLVILRIIGPNILNIFTDIILFCNQGFPLPFSVSIEIIQMAIKIEISDIFYLACFFFVFFGLQRNFIFFFVGLQMYLRMRFLFHPFTIEMSRPPNFSSKKCNSERLFFTQTKRDRKWPQVFMRKLFIYFNLYLSIVIFIFFIYTFFFLYQLFDFTRQYTDLVL